MTYEWEEADGAHRQEHAFPMRFFFHHELVHLVARSQLRLERIDGDFEGGALRDDSREFVVICTRD